MARVVATLCTVGLGLALGLTITSEAAPRLRLVLPLDIEVRGPDLYIADAERHQVLRYDLRRKTLSVFAGTGTRGTSGDGGPAVKARFGEPTEIVFDAQGNLADVNQGRIRRVDRRGTITTVARVPSVAGLAVHPDGRSLAVAADRPGAADRGDQTARAREPVADDARSLRAGHGIGYP